MIRTTYPKSSATHNIAVNVINNAVVMTLLHDGDFVYKNLFLDLLCDDHLFDGDLLLGSGVNSFVHRPRGSEINK